MMRDLFQSTEFLRVVDLLLDEPDREYNKSEIALGAGISRPTLYKVWDRLVELRLLLPAPRRGGVAVYRVDTRSDLVRSLLRFDNELSKTLSRAGIATPEPRESPRAVGRRIVQRRVGSLLSEPARGRRNAVGRKSLRPRA